MPAKAFLLLPPPPLASCIGAAVVRDTRGANLSFEDRFNHFPATPLVSVTYVVQGELQLLDNIGELVDLEGAKPFPKCSVLVGQGKPIASWSPGDVYAVTVGFYPDAWIKLGASFQDETWPDFIEQTLRAFGPDISPQAGWQRFCDDIAPIWQTKRNHSDLQDWGGSHRLTDWTRHLAARIALTVGGRSLRTLERRMHRWTNTTKQTLDYYAAIENLHQRIVENPDHSLAELAADAQFSDQSHMGRSVKRATGFSPAKLNRMIETEESFWCYRLLGERF